MVSFPGGGSLLFVANAARLVSCAFIMRYQPRWFSFTHEYLWQIGLVGLTLALRASGGELMALDFVAAFRILPLPRPQLRGAIAEAKPWLERSA